MNYFELYELPVGFILDENVVKRKFYQLSKKYHPDFYTLASAEEQAEILELSTLTNEGYKVLADADERMKYILQLKNVLDEEGKAQIPQDFLMEMMEVNEALMELEFDFDPTILAQLKNDLATKENELYQAIEPILESYNGDSADDKTLEEVKNYYYKKRYLLRIRENLNKFATL